ncbi:hypothetical protein [Verminephrobacter eiseniae]|uniref:hypothetical protein n=1 Tax=Verminephrobacter eiseniae TaxID=364317 RepID=UPI00223754D4|nr:hypothetical protein [Verminephrobacter eiseniae]
MERVTSRPGRAPGAWIAWHIRALAWGARCLAARWTRRWGHWGWCVGVLLLLIGVVGWQVHAQAQQARSLARAQASPLAPVATTPAFTAPSDAQDAAGNLRRFERILLPHDEIPQLVQDLLQWAQDEGLSIERGDYQADADSEGGFMRYRMSLPVRGKSTAVHRLILKALSAQKNLTLESLQFKREQVSSEVIEARIQWLAMTQMPPSWTAAGAAQPVR